MGHNNILHRGPDPSPYYAMIRTLFFRTSCLAKHSQRLTFLSTPVPATQRAASLSAIHRGLRRSERAQYGEARPRPISRRGMENLNNDIVRTQRALDGAGSKRAQKKLVKKLEKKEAKRDGTGPKSRRKRFHDPESEHGKHSLVYHAKHGLLKDMVEKLDEPVKPRQASTMPRGRRRMDREPVTSSGDRVTSDDFRQRMLDGQEDGKPPRSFARPAQSAADDGPFAARRTDTATTEERRDERRTRSWGDAKERGAAKEQVAWDRPAGQGSAKGRGRDSMRYERTRDRPSWQDEGSLDITAEKPRERSKGNMMPLTIKYTTAASQFLYGRSVVRSALEQARRKLYRLYIYAGENRQQMGEVNDMTRLAKRHSVPITIVPQEDQRLMDKMSQGRPHNGFVLETSPIPQKPIKALGEVEESMTRNGFHVDLDRQTTEEEAVNGTDSFVRRSSGVTTKPFVLLLDEIVDPGNLGAMLRTASYLGVDAVGITKRNTSHLTPVVLKSAAGAVEEITIFSVESPDTFLRESRKAGWRSYAAVAPPNSKLAGLHKGKFISSERVEELSPLSKDPCILVLGNEGYGLSKKVKVAADFEVSVPRYVYGSCIDSLNVSVATGLLCHSFVKKAAASKDIQNEDVAQPEVAAESYEKPVGSVMF